MAAASSTPLRRLLDAGRRTRAMLWIMAIMVFLTVLATGFGLGARHAAASLDRDLAGRLTVQVVEADAAKRDAAQQRIVDRLRALPGVTDVAPVPAAKLAELIKPWFGEAGLDADLPMPAMIDVDVSSASDAQLAAVRDTARGVTSAATVERDAAWLAPVRGFITTLSLLALALVVLMGIATASVVLLSARTGLDTHRDTIEILHMLGSTDVQVARLFQRRIALQTLIGGSIGALAGMVVAWILQVQLAGLGAQAIGAMILSGGDWLILAAVPLIFALMAMLAARLAVVRALGRTL